MAMKELIISFNEEWLGLPFAELMAFYTVQSAAKVLGFERQRIYQLIDEDALEGIRLMDEEGDVVKVVVTKRSVKAYLKYQKQREKVTKPSFNAG
jgi:hypothetical protein